MRSSTLWILVIAVIAILLLVAFLYARSSPYLISATEAKERLQRKEIDAVIDVRTLFERQNLGYYPGSIHIPAANLTTELPARYPDRATRILIYCNTGQRARAATEKARALGYTNVRYISSSHLSLM
jgi:rhodanese-related sulfurtransferase